jgi:hypothetical protein
VTGRLPNTVAEIVCSREFNNVTACVELRGRISAAAKAADPAVAARLGELWEQACDLHDATWAGVDEVFAERFAANPALRVAAEPIHEHNFDTPGGA